MPQVEAAREAAFWPFSTIEAQIRADHFRSNDARTERCYLVFALL